MGLMRNVVYCAPFPGIAATHRFARALRGLDDIKLLGVFQERPAGDAARTYDDVAIVGNALDTRELWAGVEALRRRHGPPHRILGILENLQVQLAAVRGHYGLPGDDVAAAERFRDKALMKDALRAIGVPCARHRRLHSEHDAWAFASEIGFPIVLKPTAGAGCKATYEIKDADSLRIAMQEIRPSPQRDVLAEEFLDGREYSFETICLRGTPVFHSIGRYFPGPLEVTRTPWIQWVCVLPRDISGPWFDGIRQIGFHAVQKLGMNSGMTHMEWFRRSDGSLAVGEIAMRPPGAQFVTLMSYAHDADMYRAWARAAVDDAFDGPFERTYAVGIAYLRGQGEGRVAAVEGLDRAQEKVGGLVVETKLPIVGAPKNSSYEGDGYVIVRHPDDDVVLAAMKTIVETVQVHYR
jgi:formate-dependent phosphoribosylglycinamide formyltransferase (GAR transformylase)